MSRIQVLSMAEFATLRKALVGMGLTQEQARARVVEIDNALRVAEKEARRARWDDENAKWEAG